MRCMARPGGGCAGISAVQQRILQKAFQKEKHEDGDDAVRKGSPATSRSVLEKGGRRYDTAATCRRAPQGTRRVPEGTVGYRRPPVQRRPRRPGRPRRPSRAFPAMQWGPGGVPWPRPWPPRGRYGRYPVAPNAECMAGRPQAGGVSQPQVPQVQHQVGTVGTVYIEDGPRGGFARGGPGGRGGVTLSQHARHTGCEAATPRRATALTRPDVPSSRAGGASSPSSCPSSPAAASSAAATDARAALATSNNTHNHRRLLILQRRTCT